MRLGEYKKWAPVVLMLAGMMVTSCGEDDNGPNAGDNFDQKGFLEHVGSSLIVPAYQELEQKSGILRDKISSFIASPESSTLEEAKTALFEARIAWQYCSPYQFGPAEESGLVSNLNIFPADRSKIERNIENGSYNLGTLANNDAKGFAALEYLLYGKDVTSGEVIQGFADQPQRATYLQNVAELIIATAAEVYSAWSPDGGNYLGEFTSDGALGADAGSSLGKLVNALNLSFERNTRDAKIGIPAGIRSLGITIPEATEAYYAGYSLELALANVDAYKKLFLGQTREGVKGLGFDDYLKARKAATTSGSELPLDEAINAQFDAVLGFIDQIENPLDEQISTDNSRVQQVFAQMQQLAVLLKTDMASALGVVISYQDNDGD
ncbi:conserved hypothetical protein [Imperialibacter sp. EC-SDR9]|nr:conserved hypothetical protein [Imperialibacter sp. 89]CAD5298321.1 conserved hypothetical protein [Imperialibacter sp. 75]VVT34865.1 conserved hypothetical protein [Imperialibacter sp. EC-SDR9]